jgi:hypothetical protein
MATFQEEIKVTGQELLSTLKQILKEGNARRLLVKDGAGKVLVDVPLTLGVFGVLLVPFWATVALILASARGFVIDVVRDQPDAPGPQAQPPVASPPNGESRPQA